MNRQDLIQAGIEPHTADRLLARSEQTGHGGEPVIDSDVVNDRIALLFLEGDE